MDTIVRPAPSSLRAVRQRKYRNYFRRAVDFLGRKAGRENITIKRLYAPWLCLSDKGQPPVGKGNLGKLRQLFAEMERQQFDEKEMDLDM